MIDVYCDESHDAHTFSLAGWIATPSSWDRFSPAWRTMLGRHPMPDGSLSMPTFHASEIVGRDDISDSRWKGWTFEQETAAFKDAVDQIVNRDLCAHMWPIGVSVPLPLRIETPFGNSIDSEHDIWMLAFVLLFDELEKTYPAQNGFTFMFDERPDVMVPVGKFYTEAKKIYDFARPGKLHGLGVAFRPDEEVAPLQAADLFAYEWRRRISEKRTKPNKPVRRSYKRIRECRQQNAALRAYAPSDIDAINQHVAKGEKLFHVLYDYQVPEE